MESIPSGIGDLHEEGWKITPQLRWKVSTGGGPAQPVLQQLWLSSLGNWQWRNVPSVPRDASDEEK